MNRKLFILVGLLIFACGGPLAPEGQKPEDCDDGEDNDLDGRSDCNDDGCEAHTVCVEAVRKAEEARKVKEEAERARIKAAVDKANPAALQDKGPVINLDGLDVQRHVINNDTSQPAAEAYCDKLKLANQDDWRLPTREEAVKIVESGRLVGEPSYVMWTSTKVGKSRGIIVGMSGAVNELGFGSASQCRVRCVRGAVTK